MVVLRRSHHHVNREALLEVIKTYGGRTAYSFCAAAAKEKSDASGALLLSLGSSQTMQPTQLQSLLQSRELGGGETAPAEAAAVVSLKLLGVRQQRQLSSELGCDAEQDTAAAAAGAGADTPCSATAAAAAAGADTPCSALGFDSTAGADGPGVATPRGAPLGPVIRPRSTLSLRSELLHCESVELDGDGAMAAAAAADEGEEEEGKEEEAEEEVALLLSLSICSNRSDDRGEDLLLLVTQDDAEDVVEVVHSVARHGCGVDATVRLTLEAAAGENSEGLLLAGGAELAMVTLSALLLRMRGGERPGHEGELATLAELHYAAASADYATLLQQQRPPRAIMATIMPSPEGEGEEEEEELVGEAELLAAMASLLRRMRSGEAYCESQRRVWLARNLALEAEVREARREQLEEDMQRVAFCGMFGRRPARRGAARPPRCGLLLPEATLLGASAEEEGEEEGGGKRALVSVASSGLFTRSRGRLASFFSCRRRLRWSNE